MSDLILHPWKHLRPWQRHSLVLVVAGLVYVGIGYSFISAKPSEVRTQALHFALYWLSFQSWGIVFMAVGICAIISARWPPYAKTWGYVLLTGLSGGWSAVYLCGILLYGTPTQNWTQVFTWALIAFLWWAISGLVNPASRGPHHES